MNKPLIVIFAAVGLDAVGIGLIFPILPRLLQELASTADVATSIGSMTALYALMQFVCAPVLGALSDRLGRRPVLLISLGGAAINYAVMAVAPSLWMLFVGRAIAGLTSANMSVATAYLTDISTPDQRARRFGLFNAMFGLGFIVGPVLGGVLGDLGLRLPFLAAGLLNAANLLLAWFALPESRTPRAGPIDFAALNPMRQASWIFSRRDLLGIVAIFLVMAAGGEAYGTCWALWGADTFGWNGLWIGLSLGAFGVCQSLSQALLPGPAVRWLGERQAVLAGIAGSCLALVVMAFARQGWMVFAAMPAFALAGIGVPALQSLATRLVNEEQQGQFQGALASVIGLASIVGPLLFTGVYAAVRGSWPGAVWLAVVAVQCIVVPLVLGLRFAVAPRAVGPA